MIKYLVIALFVFPLYSCSNNPLNNADQTDEVSNEITDQAGDDYHFRQTSWGMSKEEVMQSEDSEPVFVSEYKIDYETKMMDLDGKVAYTFNDNELIRASFFPFSKPEVNNGYIEIYKKIQKELKNKYGKTVIDTIQHKDPSKDISPQDYGNAICNGQLLYATQWDLPASDVQLLLRGENSECIISILYLSEEGFRKMLRDGAINSEN